MDIAKWGEEPFIEKISSLFPSKKGLVGIGDDCAVIPKEKGRVTLITTDALVEGIHFLKDKTPPEALGYKTVAVNLSDIAAMGGKPLYCFLTFSLPKETEKKWLESYLKGFKEALDTFGVTLLGGDTVGSKTGLFISLTLLGEADKKKIKYRSQAKSGDILVVTGPLGDSAAGFRILTENIEQDFLLAPLVDKHNLPRPHLEEGAFLANLSSVHAMMDLSDGVVQDLKRLAKASGLSAKLDIDKVPISLELTLASISLGWDTPTLALSGGEDYCLMAAIDKEKFSSVSEAFQKKFKRPLTVIGSLSRGKKGEITYRWQGKKVPFEEEGFKHFT